MRPNHSQYLTRALVLLTAILALPAGAVAYTGGGTGAADDPFVLTTAGDLRALSLSPGDWGLCFKLVADVDMRGVEFSPIGTAQAPFWGTFEGGTHRIANLLVYDGGPANGGAGLFGVVLTEGVLSGVILVEPTVIGDSGEYVGGLVGRLDSGTVSACAVAGGRIFGQVSQDSRTGGLVGVNVAGLIRQCSSTAMVEGTSTCGGLVGENLEQGTVLDCVVAGHLVMRPLCLLGEGYSVGGLVGVNRGGLSTSYANSMLDVLLASGAICEGCAGGVAGALIQGATPFFSVFANFSSAVLSDQAVGCGTMPPAGAQVVSWEALTHKATFKGWDMDEVWCMPAGSPPRLRWQNSQPVAVPGADQTVTMPYDQATATVWLDGSGSYDPDGDPLVYRWTLSNATYSGAQTGLVLTEGVYGVTLVVSDGATDSVPKTIQITVLKAPPPPPPPPPPIECRPPVAVAGADLVVHDDWAGHQEVQLDGSGSYDPDGDRLTYRWMWSIGGVDHVVTGPWPTVDLPVGEHTLCLVVNDGTHDSAPDTVQVSILEYIPEVSGLCSPRVIGRTSEVRDVLFCLRPPKALQEARASNVDSIQVVLPGGTAIPAAHERDGYDDQTLVARVLRRGIVDAVETDGIVSLRVLVRLKSGRSIQGTVGAEIVSGCGTPAFEVELERWGWLLAY